MPVRCLIVDDNPELLQALRSFLEREGLAIVGGASTTADALRLVEQLSPDVVLVDIDLGAESGFDVVNAIAHVNDNTHPSMILISAHSEADFADMIAASPAVGFLPKSDLSAAGILALLEP